MVVVVVRGAWQEACDRAATKLRQSCECATDLALDKQQLYIEPQERNLVQAGLDEARS
jgi:hypothetical protein